jgi:bifunctional NMN adenylyltransferase/nudix hydrolase
MNIRKQNNKESEQMTLSSFGVVVGRFQVTELHVGHRYLIDTAMKAHPYLLIIMTASGGQATNRNPLDFKTREMMIRHVYPNAVIRTLNDISSDLIWSKHLDAIIAEVTKNAPATIYMSRDSFIDCYAGRFKTEFVKPIHCISGTKTRTGMKDQRIDDPKFRQGMICAVLNQFPTAYQTVDIVVHRPETGEVLLGKKPQDDGWRFIGGFVDPTDESLEYAVKRECYEETGGIEIGEPRYIGSVTIDDCRYRGTTDGVMTAIFLVPYIFGAPRGTDDLSEIRWVRIEDVEGSLIAGHRKIWEKAKKMREMR